jgi:PAS domain S-box-containing protein
MSSLTIIYIVTATISLLLALLLIHLARLSGQTKGLGQDKEKSAYLAPELLSTESLKRAISHEIGAVTGLKDSAEQISDRVSVIFNEELSKKLRQEMEEAGRKYETIIEQKSQSEEIAWQKYNKISSDKKQTEAVIRSIADGLLVVDGQGKVLMMNPAAEKLLGVSKKDKIGRSLSENLKEEQLISLVKGNSQDQSKQGREIELISQQDETKKILRASSAVIEDENGKTVGMVSVLSDITKQKELEQLKSNFVANVSHELRTPLVAMSKSISFILSKAAGEITENQEQFLSIAERNLKRLSILINDLLDLSKLDAGKMELKRDNLSIEDVIDEIIASLNTWAQTKSIVLEKNIHKGLPKVFIDSDRMIQVFNNLIGNAIKFTPNNGRIIIEVKLSTGQIEVSIQDNGIGIDPEDLPKVFEKFYQTGERASTDIGGTGIGLSIAREIIQLHGGKIWAESEKGKGAKFIFTLPLQDTVIAGG